MILRALRRSGSSRNWGKAGSVVRKSIVLIGNVLSAIFVPIRLALALH
jgi:hypothetical protein